jgi:HAD superfamily hydrolase (TIGR01457 family)
VSARGGSTGAGLVARRYDAVLFDLDGVVYRGDEPIASAPATIESLRNLGTPVVFLTNNSSRTPELVAAQLSAMGVKARPEEIVTSGRATAAMLEEEGGAGSSAFVIGEAGVREALRAVGIILLDGEPARSDLVVVGWDRSVDYSKLRTASLLVERGARLIGTNADASYPAPDGLWPGAGAILAAVTTTTGALPTIAGKPARPMFEAAARMVSATRPLVVGDRLDTDIAGAAAMGWDSMLVLSGASTPSDVIRSAALPSYVARDLTGILGRAPPASFRPAVARDAAALAELLRSSGLSAEGLEGRLTDTLVSDDPDRGTPLPLTATACLQTVESFGILRSVAVREDVRGCGLGMLATAAACHVARDRDVSHITLFTEMAAHFFEHVGFRPVERLELPEPVATSHHAAEECSLTATAMVLDL